MKFNAVKNRGVFCDGFLFPTQGFNPTRYIKEVLDRFDLSVKFVSPKPTGDYHFVMLDDEDFGLKDIHTMFCSIFDDANSHPMQLRSQFNLRHYQDDQNTPHLGKIDLT